MTSPRILFSNGVVSYSSDTPSVSTLLQDHPGAYPTTRTHNNGSCLIFWDRHLQRPANSVRILYNSSPHFLFKPTQGMQSLLKPISSSSIWESMMKSLVNDSTNEALPVASREKRDGEEMAVTVLISGDFGKLSGMEDVGNEDICRAFDVYVHFSGYVPSVFCCERKRGPLGFGGSWTGCCRGKVFGLGKVNRLRKPLERLRLPSVTELLLSNDGDQLLEGSITNFFVVCRKSMLKQGNPYL